MKGKVKIFPFFVLTNESNLMIMPVKTNSESHGPKIIF